MQNNVTALSHNDTADPNNATAMALSHANDVVMTHFGHTHTVADTRRDAGYIFTVTLATTTITMTISELMKKITNLGATNAA
jgi:DNA-binding transcriptional regulator GbsR (MarR family)